MIKQLLTSVIVTIIVSASISFGLSQVFGFWKGFVLFFIIQFIGFYLFNNFNLTKRELEMEKILNERYETLSKNRLQFECPCGRHTFDEIVYFNDEGLYKCASCENNIKLNLTITPTVVTSPIDLQKTLQTIKMLDEGTSVE